MIRIIIPAFNEEGNIADTIEHVGKNLKGSNHKIYAVDDGSRDKTPIILKKLGKKYPLEILSHKTNLGVADAFKTGINAVIKEGKGDGVVIIMEADGTSDPRLLPKMAKKIQTGCDLVIASRYIKGGGYKGFPLKRLFFSKAANLILKTFIKNKSITDCTIFYRAYKYNLLQKGTKKYGSNFITTKHFTSNAELLFKLAPLAKKICEVPFMYDYTKKKGKSSLKINQNLKQYFVLLRSFVSFPSRK